jgi:hypothetical protein
MLFNLSAAISLILGITIVVLWFRSLGSHEWISYNTQVKPDFSQVEYWVGWGNRSIGVGRNAYLSSQQPSRALPAGWFTLTEANPGTWFLLAVDSNGHLWNGFGYARWQAPLDASGIGSDSVFISFPHWSAMLLLSIAPILWLVLRIRRWQNRAAAGGFRPAM